MRKADEMEKAHNDKSAKNAFLFYTAALLIWSMYDLFTKGKTGWEFTVLLIGNAIFFWTRVAYDRKTRE
ncbi:hypothetical protein [Falsibacillus albus]|uniref:Uncharacterized protein n=1 Tax=Falsibacillus albus TaxID=2478915 RepID=A0A3L7JZQ3_9BACI|nr:hypothetical protein [Falsibacillus albus]RLQ93862.1 hypothetical protein D9X91_16100 [Falsibacillus albus]